MNVRPGVILFIVFFLLPASLDSQNIASIESRDTTFYIHKFKLTGDGPTKKYASSIPKIVCNMLDESKQITFKVKYIDMIVSDSADVGDYNLTARCWEDGQIIYVEGTVKRNGKLEFMIHAMQDTTRSYMDRFTSVEKLAATQIFQHIIIGLQKGIRIGITKFPMVGGDDKLKYFENSIPNLLSTHLNISPKLTLIEGHIDEIRKDLELSLKEGVFDLGTATKYGKLIIANYLIMGYCWELKGKLRIDVRCVDVVNSETIVSEGIIADTIDITEINEKIQKLASLFRARIIENIQEGKERKTETIAVVGLPPSPDTENNQKRTEYLVEAVAGKLRAIFKDSLFVKENQKNMRHVLDRSTERLELAVEMDADILFSLQYIDQGENNIRIYLDVFKMEEPKKMTYVKGKSTNLQKIDETINIMICEASDSLGKKIKDDSPQRKEMRDISVKSVTKSHDICFRYGVVMTTTDGPLEYKNNSSFSISISMPSPVQPFGFHPDQFRIMPILTWDWGNNTLENLFLGDEPTSVHVFSLMLAGKYDFKPYNWINPYLGVGFGFLWLRRIRSEDESFLHAPGENGVALTAITGVDFHMGSSSYLRIPLKAYISLLPFAGDFYLHREYNGGHLLGLNVGLGYCHRW